MKIKKAVSVGAAVLVAVSVGVTVGELHSNAHYSDCTYYNGTGTHHLGCHSEYHVGYHWNLAGHQEWCRQEYCNWLVDAAAASAAQEAANGSQTLALEGNEQAAGSNAPQTPVAPVAENNESQAPAAEYNAPTSQDYSEPEPAVEQSQPSGYDYVDQNTTSYDYVQQNTTSYDYVQQDTTSYDYGSQYSSGYYCPPQSSGNCNNYNYSSGHHSGGHHGRGHH